VAGSWPHPTTCPVSIHRDEHLVPPCHLTTEGDSLCDTDVPSVAIDSVTLLICLCGLAGNRAVLWVLGFCIQRDTMKPITACILGLAIINFLFLIFMVSSTLLFLLEDLSCSAITSPAYISFLFLLLLMFHSVGLYQLMAISIERCRCILCPRGLFCHLPQDLSWVLVSAVLWALSITSHEQEQCQVGLTSMYALNLFLVAVPMVISSTILFIHLKAGSQQQQQHKRLDIVIVLVALFSLPLSLWSFLQQLSYTAVPSHVVFLLTCITSSIKPFIYFLVGSWKRDCSMGSWEALQSVFEQPEENSASGNVPLEIMDTEA
uniref:G-protein coupled receptors family 1 profile domain-containing protein n=1 Tax=Taeniopygia guttata TaxID=59729 RepID=A0A674GVQ8_TAEGU